MTMDQRQYPRATPRSAIAVVDALTGKEFGTVGNLSTHGLMIITNAPVDEDLLLQLRFTIDAGDGGSRTISAGVESLWCSPANQPDRYWAGFEIVEISDDDQEFLASLID